MGNFVEDSVKDLNNFARESVEFIQKCSKPNKQEFMKIVTSCAIGFLIMGVIGYLIKLMFIPINSILLSN